MRHTLAALALSALMPLVLSSPASIAAPSASASRPIRPATSAINLNTADAATLAREMDGIGEAKARAIVEHRQRNGVFRSVDDLALVKGIGRKTLETNRARLTVGSGAAAKPTARSEVTRAAGR